MTSKPPKILALALLVTALAIATPGWATAQETGNLVGKVILADGTPLGGVTVVIDELQSGSLTEGDGSFAFSKLPVGSYTVRLSIATHIETQPDVQIEPDSTTELTVTVDWAVAYADTITVYSASQRLERIVEAPAAISSLGRAEIELRETTGQVPKLLEFAPGVELAQNGLYDYNLNVRGFNSPLSKRVRTLVDGRDNASPFSGHQDWILASPLTDDLASVELVRGPSAALYGSNTFNGVLNLITKRPRDSQGGRINLAAGSLDTQRLGARWATELGSDWYLKLIGNSTESDDFTRNRNETVEYEGLDLEAIPQVEDRITLWAGALRLDKYYGDNLLTLEGSVSETDGLTIVIPFGRGQGNQIDWIWGRVNFNSPRWNALLTYNDRSAVNVALGPGAESYTAGKEYKVEIQANQPFAGGRGRFVGGASYGEETGDTENPQGVQTLLAKKVTTHEEAVFGQVDYDLNEKLTLVAALRWDKGTLYDGEISPKAYLLWAVSPSHTLRFGYNESFQVPTFLEVFIQSPAGPPLDLSPIEQAFAPLLGGVPLGLEFVPILALGNDDLGVERIRSIELGYKGIVAQRGFLTIDYYNTEMEMFITDLLPGVNPRFAPYQAPAALPNEVATLIESTLRAAIPGLTNDETGAPILVFSHTNSGQVDTQGLEVGFSYQLPAQVRLDFSYAWLDFEVREQPVGAEILPNAPENQFSLGASWSVGDLEVSAAARWVEKFFWSSGIFAGPVPSYQVVNLNAAYHLTDNWRLGLNVSNLLNDKHYEVFGGSILERHILGSVSYSW